MLDERSIIDQFCRAMREKDIDVDPQDIIADGRLHRIHVNGDRNKAKSGWYVLHLTYSPVPAGAFGCNKRYGNETKFTWKADRSTKPLTADERKKFKEEMTRKRHEREAIERAEHAQAAELANEIWNKAREATDHPYLTRKGIKSHGLRISAWEKINTETGEIRLITKLALLIPIRDAKKNIHSLQAIFPNDNNPLNRDKDYLAHGKKHSMFYSIGKPQTVDGKQVIIICEGYATGASLHEATDHAVIVAFDAPNLIAVAKIIREKFPTATIIIAADNDRWTLKPIENPGVTRAREAADAIDGLLAIPEFEDLSEKPTDFNDLHLLEGPAAVEACIENVVAEAGRLQPVLFVHASELPQINCIEFVADYLAMFGGELKARLSPRGVLVASYDDVDDLRVGLSDVRRFMQDANVQVLASPGLEGDISAVSQAAGASVRLPGRMATWADALRGELAAKIGSQSLMKPMVSTGVAPVMRGDFDSAAPLAMGMSGDLSGFWTRERKVVILRPSDIFKDAGILRLQNLSYWQAFCTDAGANTKGGKYDRTMVGNFLVERTKLAGSLDARNVPSSVASPDVVRHELGLAMMHAKPSAHVISLVLLSDPEWHGVVWLNVFAKRVEARVEPPCGGAVGPWTDRHDTLLGAWLSANYGVSVSKTMVVESVGLLAHADQRHPVRDYLNSLAWDGNSRLDTWLTTFAGCEDNIYTRHVAAKTLIGAVARIMQPGVKFDTTLVLEGDQGRKKSALISALAPREEWFTDSLDGDLASKDAAIGLAGKWLIEVPELATLGRTRVEVVKSFLTRRVDHFRAPYAIRAEGHPRECAFFGTINPEADGRYLSDTTGGRRFWPVQVRCADVEALKVDRDQVWAEAVARYREGEQWWLTDEIEVLAKHEQANRQESNPWVEHVERFLADLPPDAYNSHWRPRPMRVRDVTSSEIFEAITGRSMTKKDNQDAKLITAALKAAGWKQKSDKSRRWVQK